MSLENNSNHKHHHYAKQRLRRPKHVTNDARRANTTIENERAAVVSTIAAQLASVGCFVGSVWMTVSLFLQSRLFSRNDHLGSVDINGEANDSERIANVYDDTCDGDEL